jgi:hypothetical protein
MKIGFDALIYISDKILSEKLNLHNTKLFIFGSTVMNYLLIPAWQVVFIYINTFDSSLTGCVQVKIHTEDL